MQREIKFRAWHIVKKIMATVGDLNWSGKVHVSYKSGPEKSGYFFGGNNVGDNWEKDEHKLMQYTGLKDKEGKEIYEGDIVKCSYFKMSVGENMGVTEVDAELTGVIAFNDLSLCVSNIIGEKWSHYTGYGVGEGACEFTYLHDVYESSADCEMSIEVIGNIYENPELLTK